MFGRNIIERIESLEEEMTLLAVDRRIAELSLRFPSKDDREAFKQVVASEVKRIGKGAGCYVGPDDTPLTTFVMDQFENFSRKLQQQRRTW